ncbi:MAG: heavy metal-responsive transcriptional regulator [Nostoc sp. DedVER02]|uniref:heavy metal-responsive transcriptional regulator n=1 Tax=unclassified Nostoc TaxID=2593658 RepID=UPI002AD43EF1|nr:MULTISPECIES: heavy metal-responsive transcriptional regulator [unclassified Nostoc]MDZ7989661.1 heavy metal-responsive transcriptional regulator [Nostoc sp. DedVER02]MDZ8113397.1 heavy metal-responsive transcriptional regulator [Nostoc sp. DedVER01b]
MLAQEQPKLIGSVAKESSVPIKTIRYYEELGLLKSSGRTEGRFRLFNADILARLHFIKRAQSLGLSLSEIKEFLDVHDGGELPCEHIKTKLEDKVKAIDEQIQQLLILKQDLQGLLSGWEIKPENTYQTICPIIE